MTRDEFQTRIHDVILYAFLLLGLVREKQWAADDANDIRKRIDEVSPGVPYSLFSNNRLSPTD